MSAVTMVGCNGRYKLRGSGRKRNVALVANLIVLMSTSGCTDRGGNSVPVPTPPKPTPPTPPTPTPPTPPTPTPPKPTPPTPTPPMPQPRVPIRIPELTDDEKGIADWALHNAPPDEILTRVRFPFGALPGAGSETVAIQPKMIRTSLLPRQWLEEDIIHAYFAVLQKKAPRFKFVGGHFYRFLETDAYKYNFGPVLGFDVLIFPVNTGQLHWTLGVIDFKAKQFLHVDSMSGALPQNFETKMRLYLRTLDIPADGWEFVHKALGWQKNSYDCGVFTCFLAERISDGQTMDFGNEYIPQQGLDILRKRIAMMIVEDAQVRLA